MARKGENIFLRKDGRWEARYVKDYTIDNKIIYGYVYEKTYSAAKKKRNNILLNLNNEDKKRQTKRDIDFFDTIIDIWLIHKKMIVKESTYSRYIDIINIHLRPFFGHFKTNEINDEIISKFILLKLNAGLSTKTIKDILTLLKQITKYGKINITVNSPKVYKKTIKILESEEQKKLEFYICNNLNCITLGIMLSLYMGLRIGEVCALKWEDVDLKRRVLNINHTISRIKNLDNNSRKKTKIVIDTPKTENAKRIIPIPSTLFPFLEKFESSNDNFILTNSSKFIETRSYYNKFIKIMKKLEISNCNFHSLRHTFATRCVELGFDPKTLSEILGHSDIKITLSLYVHPTNNLKITSMEKLKILNI